MLDPFIVTLFLIEPPRKKMDSKTHFKNVKKILKYLFTEDKVATLSLKSYCVGLAHILLFGLSKVLQIQDIDISSLVTFGHYLIL